MTLVLGFLNVTMLIVEVDASEDESRIRLLCWLITDRTLLTLLIVWITDPTFLNLLKHWITDPGRLDQNVAALYRRKRLDGFEYFND
jgi:hypothetical protein